MNKKIKEKHWKWPIAEPSILITLHASIRFLQIFLYFFILVPFSRSNYIWRRSPLDNLIGIIRLECKWMKFLSPFKSYSQEWRLTLQFQGFREEVKYVSANQRPGRPNWFSDWPEKHKLGRGRWDLASSQVSSNSIQRFQRSWKCLSKSEARVAILVLPLAQKIQTWERTFSTCFLQ